MKIEDAIKRYESWAEDDRIDVLIRKEHKQIADWLKELKAYRQQGDIIRCKECRHWYRALDESGIIERINFSRCTKGHFGNGLGFYCADGERSR
jgi:hypothetical protein